MKILLDTHCWLWALGEPEKLGEKARNLIADRKNELYLSVASIWELGIKVKIGKINLSEPFEEFILKRLIAFGMNSLDITLDHAVITSDLPLHHKDPFDRMLIAQAQVEKMSVLTVDKAFNDYLVDIISGS